MGLLEGLEARGIKLNATGRKISSGGQTPAEEAAGSGGDLFAAIRGGVKLKRAGKRPEDMS